MAQEKVTSEYKQNTVENTFYSKTNTWPSII